MVFKIQSTIVRSDLIIFTLLGLLFSCQEVEEKNNNHLNLSCDGYVSQNPNIFGDYIDYNGNFILIEDQEVNDQKFYVQRIEQQINSLKYGAEKVPREIYFQSKGLTGNELESALVETEGELIYFIDFEDVKKEDLMNKHFSESMDESVAYLSFEIAKDFYLISSANDTLFPAFTQYERDFKISPKEKVMICFSGTESKQTYALHYKDELFGNGSMGFSFAPDQMVEHKNENPS